MQAISVTNTAKKNCTALVGCVLRGREGASQGKTRYDGKMTDERCLIICLICEWFISQGFLLLSESILFAFCL